MRSHVSEIAPDIYRISTFNAEFEIQFNQLLIADDEPFLMHTRGDGGLAIVVLAGLLDRYLSKPASEASA